MDNYTKAFEKWAGEWELTHSRPTERQIWQFMISGRTILALVVAVSAAVLAGMRTGAAAASISTLNQFGFGVLEGILAVCAVEIGIVIYTVELERSSTKKSKSGPWMIAGLVVALLVSAVLNWDTTVMGVGGGLAENWGLVRDVLIGISLGLGMPALTVIAGKIVGGALVAAEKEHAKASKTFQDKYQEWLKQRLRAWDRAKRSILPHDASQAAPSGRKKVVKKRYPCEQCGRVFDSPGAFAAHVRWQHPKESVP